MKFRQANLMQVLSRLGLAALFALALPLDSGADGEANAGNSKSTLQQLRDWLGFTPAHAPTQHLLNGKDLDAFYTWIEKDGTFWDKDGVFTLTNGILRISGKRRGYIATKNAYSNYHLVAEYKWGEQTWGSRTNRPRNSGILIHGTGLDKVWMKSIECQIAEGQTGDVVVLEGAQLCRDGVTKVRSYDTFKRPGDDPVEDRVGYRAPHDLEKPHGEWNTMEIFCYGSRLKVVVNGKTAFIGSDARPNMGRILLQSNGAEIFFRRLDLQPLNCEP